MHALKDSLSAIEAMFQDILDPRGDGQSTISASVREQLERAQRLVTGVRTQPTRIANEPQQLIERMEASDLAKRLSNPEKHIIRQVKLRNTMNPVVLGSGAERLYKFGLLLKEGAVVRLSDKGVAVNGMF